MIEKTSSRTTLALLAGAGLLLAGCADSELPLGPDPTETTTLLSVQPQGGATDVDRSAPVVVAFDHAMMEGMETWAALHEGAVTGPVVAGSWTMSEDHRAMTFTPDAPLAPHTTYTVHLGGGMMDAEGDHVDFDTHGEHMGGAWATETMMTGGGMMGGDHMDGMGDHMGDGWQHPGNGSYGMVFSFTTGA